MSVYTKEQLKEIAEVCKKADLFIISDETQDLFVYDSKHISIATLPGMDKRTVVLKSFATKIPVVDFSCGYIMTCKDIANQINKLAMNTYSSLPIFNQQIMLEFLQRREYFDFVKEKMRQRKDMFVKQLKSNQYFKLDYEPLAGNCVLLNCSGLLRGKSFKNSYELADYMVKRSKIYLGVVPSVLYGIDNYIVLYYSNIESSKVLDICKRLYGAKEENV
jgi:aspartate/methionine/tyrosine aminotransferase